MTEYKKGTLVINRDKEVYFGGVPSRRDYNPGSWGEASFIILEGQVKGIEQAVLVYALTIGKIGWLYHIEVDQVFREENTLITTPIEEK